MGDGSRIPGLHVFLVLLGSIPPSIAQVSIPMPSSTPKTTVMIQTPSPTPALFATCSLDDGSMGIECPVTRLCIPGGAECDGFDDCGAGEEEENCPDTGIGGCEEQVVDAEGAMRECSNSVDTVTLEGMQIPDTNMWGFDVPIETGELNQTYIVTEVIFDYSRGGTGLYRVNFTEDNYVMLYSSESDIGGTQQTKRLAEPYLFKPDETSLTIEKYNGMDFRPSPGSISIVIEFGSCEVVSRDCLINIGRVSRSGCSRALDVQNYSRIFSQCPISQLRCNQGEFMCGSGLCIPEKFRCDGNRDDCIEDNSDEEDCEVDPGCYNVGSIVNCAFESHNFRPTNIYSTQNSSSMIEFVAPDIEGLFVRTVQVTIEPSGNGPTFFRINVTTLSGTEVVHSRQLRSTIFFSFDGLLPLRRSESVRVTLEGIRDLQLDTWEWLNASSTEITGVAYNEVPCNQSFGCLESLSQISRISPSCYFHSFISFVSEKLEPCKVPPAITFLSADVHLRSGSAYDVACIAVAEGGLPPIMEFIVRGTMEYNDTGSRIGFDGHTAASVGFSGVSENTMVTCRASLFGLTVERTMTIHILDGGCAAKLDEAQSFTNADCLPFAPVFNVEPIGMDYLHFTPPLFESGYLVNGSIGMSFLDYAPVVDFKLEVRLTYVGQPSRKRRSLGNLEYQRTYRDVVIGRTTEEDFTLYFDPPIWVPGDYLIELNIERLSLPLGPIRDDSPPPPQGVFGFLPSCMGEEDQQFCDMEQWARAVDEDCFQGKNIPELEGSRQFLAAVEICHGITRGEPEIILDPEPLVEASLDSSFIARCEVANAVDVEWYKREWYGEVPTGLTSNILSFEQFDSRDQGLYYCVGFGGSDYSSANVSSEPVAVVLNGFSTFLATQRFTNLNVTRPLMNPNDKEFGQITSIIEDYYLEFGQVESIMVQFLRPGSVIADMQLVVPDDSIEPVRAFVTNGTLSIPGEFGLELDYSASQFRSVSFCEASLINDSLAGPLNFPNTTIATTAESLELCPSYSSLAGSPRATRACRGDFISPSYWEEPTITNCFEGDETEGGLGDLTEYVVNNPVGPENVTSVSRDLADATAGSDDLTGEDLEDVAKLLEDIIEINSSSPEVTSNVVEIVDNILDLKGNTYEESLPGEAPISILRSLEGQLTNLHDGGQPVNFSDVRAFVGAVAMTLGQSDFGSSITFGSFFLPGRSNITENLDESKNGISDSHSLEVKATITIPKSILDGTKYAGSDAVPLTFIIHRTSNLFRTNVTAQTDRLQVESLIISATIEGVQINDAQDPVVTRFHLLPLEVVTDESSRGCYFWDFSLLDGLGDWSSDGCRLVSGAETGATDELIGCNCDHLTNFAILLDVQGDVQSRALDILSIIGCVISIIAVIITIVTFLGVKKFRSQRPKQILVHLCFALLGLYLSFLVGIDRSSLQIGCVVFGALIHYFCLASVAWMTVEAVNMYLLFIKVFASGIRWFMVKAAIGAWGLPLLVVIVSVILRSEHYHGDYCFPQSDTWTFYIGVCVLIAILLVGNLITFILVVRQLTQSKSVASKDQDRRQEALRYIAISVLLGLAWVFGYLALGGAQFIFNLLFLVFNTLQGFFIFLFFCLRQPDVRGVWWEWLHCRKYEPGRVTSTDTGVVKHQPKSHVNSGGTNLTGSTTAVNSESLQMVAPPQNGNGGADSESHDA